MWSYILPDQLSVSDDEFWACVRDGVRPDRGMPEPPAQALPADLVYLLVNRVGLTEAEVAAMSREEAIDRLRRFWMKES